MSRLFKPIILLYSTLIIVNGFAQEKHVLTFSKYINNVKNANVSYLAERFNINIAEANIQAVKVFPDPELSASYSNNQDWNLHMGYGVDIGLNYTLELGGKRRARIKRAQSEKEMTDALLEDYFRNLRADAAIAYLSALRTKQLSIIQKSSYYQMYKLAQADSLRFYSGTITETDARQSKLEAATMLNDVYKSEGELRNAIVQLQLFQGNIILEYPDSIAGKLSFHKREFDLPNLITTAQNNRADLQAALKSKEMSQNDLLLVKANRITDLGLNIGGSYSSKVRNEIAPAPAFKGIVAGISIPLKLSNMNKGELRAAQFAVTQNEMRYQAVELELSSQVTQAYNQYIMTCLQVEQFNTGLLNEAETILKKKVYSYERGETSMIELLNAQRTYNDVQTSYCETLYNCAVALIELERACGIWDIEI
ncbi:MAG: TolC family protein [Rikenellaceae bacterium]|nr:TolC family protein [Rikenellaceae bacterium]